MEQTTQIIPIKAALPGKKRGRKPLIVVNPEIVQRIAERIKSGAFVEMACQEVGISRDTYWRAMELGAEGKPQYKEFCDVLKKAEAEAENNAAQRLYQATGNQGIAPAIWLERARRDRWSRSDKIADVSVPVTVVVQNFAADAPKSRP